MAEIKHLSTEELVDLLNGDEDFVLLDVRPQILYEQGHIPGAVGLTLTRLRNETQEHLPDKKAKIVLYCNNGRKSGEAARHLVDEGYEDVNDTPGLIDWPYTLEK